MSFNTILRFRGYCKNHTWNKVEIMDFRVNSTFYLKPILHTFQRNFQVCDVKINILRDRFLFYTEEAAIFEVILSICSEFYQIGTPHFSLEGVVGMCSPFTCFGHNRVSALVIFWGSFLMGGVVASWLVCSSLDRAVQV